MPSGGLRVAGNKGIVHRAYKRISNPHPRCAMDLPYRILAGPISH
jgi:hypothetical protein